MNHLRIISVAILFVTCTLTHADIDVTKLIKVTKENNPKCVEYYNIAGELYCSATLLSTTPTDPNLLKSEKQKIIFDDRPWQAVWGKIYG